MAEKKKGFKIYGRVIVKETGRGIPNVIVEALDKDLIYDDRLGSVITDKDGNFEILYDREDFQELFFDRKPDIYLRIRRAGGKAICTTEDKVRYKAGKIEAFYVNIPKSKIEEEEAMKETNYKIEGKIDPKILEEVPKELGLRIYAVRDRKVLGSSPIERDGSFSIKYKYDIYEKEEKRLAIGPSLIAGPDFPGDEILKAKFPGVFLPPEEFKEKEGEWCGTVPPKLTAEIISKPIIDKWWIPWWKTYCYEWRPCVEVLACSKIEAGLCYDEQPLTNVHVRIYEVGWCWFPFPGGHKYTKLVAEGDTDGFGYFKTKKIICKKLFLLPLCMKSGYLVEVGQIIDGVFNSIYKDPDDQPRELKSDLCEEVYIDKTKVITPEPPEGLLTGNTFKLTRIGNIPVGYINQDPTSPFHGYANSMAASDSATLKVIDSAFYSEIKLYANIGAGIVNTVKYYKIKCSYKINGTSIDSYIQVPFYNLRESTNAEKPIFGPYKTEFMGPTTSIYAYPNPYDLAVDKQWVYKGLILVLNTATLPLPYGKYTLTIEPLDASKNPVPVDNPSELTCTILVDNTAPSGSFGQIIGPYGTAAACGFLKLNPAGTYIACDGNTRNRVSGRITVPFSAQDGHGNIHSIVFGAYFGDVCDAPVTLVGSGKKPEISMVPGCSGCGGTSEYQNYNDVPLAQRPNWSGNSNYCTSLDRIWDECAYQFRLTIYKRVTNGEVAYPWWDFAKHITITRT
jgi:hypothetical protein